MKKNLRNLILLTLLLTLMLSYIHPSDAAIITEYNVPGELASIPRELVVDKDGWLWFTEYGGHEIGRFKDGAFREYFVSSGSFPWGIDFDSPNWVYYTDGPNKIIARIGSGGGDNQITQYSLPPDYSAGLRGLAVQDDDVRASDDNIWFADYTGHRIGLLKILSEGFNVIAWALPSDSTPESLIYTSSTGLWCTDYGRSRLWNIPNETSSVIKYVQLPDGSNPADIDVDSFGNLWFTLFSRNSIGKYNPRLNEFTDYRIPTSGSKPYGIAVDYSNRVWFVESATNKIAFFNPDSETFTEYARMGASGSPTYLALSRADEDNPRRPPIFFSDPNFGKIGKIDPYKGMTTSFVSFFSPVVITSSTGISTSTLSSGVKAGYFSFSHVTTTTSASMSPADVVGTTYNATETVKYLRTSAMDVTTIFSTLTGTTSTLTTVIGTSTSYIATTTGTLTTTSFATSTSYVATTTGTLTTFKTTTSYTTAFETTTTGMIIVPGYRPTAILLGVLLGIIFLLSFRISRRAKHGRLRILQDQKGYA